MLTTGGEDRNIILWSAVTLKRLVTLQGHRGTVRSLAFSPDGTTLAPGGEAARQAAHQALLRQRPDHVQALVNLGGIHATLREIDEATTYYERTIQLDPSRKELRVTIGALRRQRKK